MTIRKNQASLTREEKSAFVSAILKLKNSVPSQLGLTNRYDDYVYIHMESMMLPDGSDRAPGWAHRAPAFGPWHRALLRNLELDLQSIDSTVSLPYWDWTINNSPEPTAAGSPWTNDFMGGNGDPAQSGKVIDGPFAFDAGKWTLNVKEHTGDTNFLARRFGTGESVQTLPTLPTLANVQGAIQETPYDSPQWDRGASPSFRDRLEGWHGAGSIHNRVHLWVGGSMLPSTSPNDPVFFLHHCNIDRLWAEWQRLHPNEPYFPGSDVVGAPQGHKLKDPMLPWGGTVTVESTLDHKAMGYSYDTDSIDITTDVLIDIQFEQLLKWEYKPTIIQHQSVHMEPMFDISPEDKAAGGHDLGM